MENPEVDKTRKLVICCSRGINSKEIAKKLEEEGLDAVSLEKGYIAWLMDAMKSSQDEDFAKNVEISLRKKFKDVYKRQVQSCFQNQTRIVSF